MRRSKRNNRIRRRENLKLTRRTRRTENRKLVLQSLYPDLQESSLDYFSRASYYKKRPKKSGQSRDKKMMPRRPHRNYHHFILSKHDGGDSSRSNLLLIDIEKHEAFNRLFGPTCSAEKALAILQRALRAKQAQCAA